MLRRRRRASPEVPTASMPDIAFLLIIFFLVTTTLYMDKGLGLVLPRVGQTKVVPRKNICNVWVNAAGEVAVEGEVVPLGELREEVARRLKENPKLIVSLKVDELAKYKVFVDVLDELKLAGAARISIASPEVEGGP